MASPQLDTAGTKGDEKMSMLPSSEHEDTLSGDTPVLLDFTQLTPAKFGISTQSFTPLSSNQRDKALQAQLKARRRSNIGARGSPGTNSLICFIAQQKTSPSETYQTPEPVESSPSFPRVASTLRQKMAAFQSLMDLREESEACDPMQDSFTGRCIKTRDYQSDDRRSGGGKENHPPPITPTPKRRRVGSFRDWQPEISEASSTSVLQHRKEQEVDEKPAPHATTPGPIPSGEVVEEAHAALLFPPLHLDSVPATTCELQAFPSTKNQQEQVGSHEGSFEPQSPSRPQPDGPAASLPTQPASPFAVPSLPSLQEMNPTGDCSETSAVRKKRVRFGGPLSPEFFDKDLPPSTPLQKGGTPAQAPTPGGCFQPRSVLKTPQRNSPLGQPDFNSPLELSASPTFAIPRNCRVQFTGDDGADIIEKIAFPSLEELDSSLTDYAERSLEVQPLDLNSAFQEESLTEPLTGPDPEPEAVPITTSQIDDLDKQQETQTEPTAEAPAPGQSINLKRKSGLEPESTVEAPARSRSSRKRKQPEGNKPVKRSTRSAAKSACGKMKTTSKKKQWGAKEVDRALYGSRVYASKDPSLSPITESLCSTNQSLQAQDQEPLLSLPSVGQLNADHIAAAPLQSCSPTGSDITTTDPCEYPVEAPVQSVTNGKGRGVGKGMRCPGPRRRSSTIREVRGRGLRGRKVSVPADGHLSEQPQDQQTGGRGGEHREDQTTTNLEAAKETPSKYSAPEDGEVGTDGPRTSADSPCRDTDSDAGRPSSPDAPTSARPPVDVEINTVNVSARRSRSRRRTLNSSVLQEREEEASQTAEHPEGPKSAEKGPRDRAASQLETNSQSSSNSQVQEVANQAEEEATPVQEESNPAEEESNPAEEEANPAQEEANPAEEEANQALASWQGQFNIEDVLKAVSTRGPPLIRRSLRNQSNVEGGGSGLVWLQRTSPDKESRRRTRGRRLSTPLLPYH